jgi:hypothetical protein
MSDLRTGSRVLKKVFHVPDLFPFAEFKGGNPRRYQIKLVAEEPSRNGTLSLNVIGFQGVQNDRSSCRHVDQNKKCKAAQT